jgi:hypothetical protein
LLSVSLANCKKEDTVQEENIQGNANINLTTSYYLYAQPANFLYTNLSTIFQSVHGGYFPYEFSARAFYDFDKDGDLDLIGATFNDHDAPIEAHYYKNNGGNYQKDQSVFDGNVPGYVHARQAILADFDKNGWMDVVIIAHGYDRAPQPGEKQKVLMNFNGKFTTKELSLPAPNRLPYTHSGCAGDIDNDGDVDLFFTSVYAPVAGIFMKNNGSGVFTYDAGIFPADIKDKPYNTSALYDLNQDGYLDLVICGHDNAPGAADPMYLAKPMVLWGNSKGKYTSSNSTTLPVIKPYGITNNINFLDFDKDGKIDILLTKTGDGTELNFYQGYYTQLLKNKGGNSFTDATVTNMGTYRNDNPTGGWILWLRPHDIDNDGDLDITSEDKIDPHEWINNSGIFIKK